MTDTRACFAFFHTLRVRWAELDPQGIVFNPNYLVYFDTAGTEYMRAIGYAYPVGLSELGADLYTVNANANYRDSARYDDVLDIGVRVGKIGRSSMRFDFGVFRDDDLLVDGALTYVCAGGSPRVSVPVPDAFVDRILAFEKTPPARG